MTNTCCCREQTTCCSGSSSHASAAKPSVEQIPIISTQLTRADMLNNWKVRWGIGRMSAIVTPGMYRIGQPDANSPVLATANYRLTFDALRKELGGISAWILVLDTRGVNVWCAAGKGTFGTAELVARINAVNLHDIVTHRTLIVPQLGATGVAAHEVLKASGFKVIYGPVRAKDIPAFLQNGLKKTAEMSTVEFTLRDRLAVIPVEIAQAVKPTLLVFAIFWLLRSLIAWRLDFAHGFALLWAYLGAMLVGTVIFPILLPYLPSRAFAVNGAILGVAWGIASSAINRFSMQESIAATMVLAALASFFSMNFTGSTTFTSLSGAKLEVKTATPILAVCAVVGLILGVI